MDTVTETKISNPMVTVLASDVVASNLIGRINYQIQAQEGVSAEARTAFIDMLHHLPAMLQDAYDGDAPLEAIRHDGCLAIVMSENCGTVIAWDVKAMLERGLPTPPKDFSPADYWGVMYDCLNNKQDLDEDDKGHRLYWALSLRVGEKLLREWVKLQESEIDKIPVMIVMLAGKTEKDDQGEENTMVAGATFIVPMPITLADVRSHTVIH